MMRRGQMEQMEERCLLTVANFRPDDARPAFQNAYVFVDRAIDAAVDLVLTTAPNTAIQIRISATVQWTDSGTLLACPAETDTDDAMSFSFDNLLIRDQRGTLVESWESDQDCSSNDILVLNGTAGPQDTTWHLSFYLNSAIDRWNIVASANMQVESWTQVAED